MHHRFIAQFVFLCACGISKLQLRAIASITNTSNVSRSLTLVALLTLFQSSIFAQIRDDIQTHMRTDSYATLTLKHADKSIDIPLIKFASQQALTKGTIVLLSDAQSHKSANQSLYQLAKALPNWGWNTLLVTPQTGYFVEPPEVKESTVEDTEDGEQTTESNPDEEATDNNVEDTNNGSDGSEQKAADQTATEQSPENTEPSPQVGIQAITLQEAELGFTQAEYESFISALLMQINTRFLQQPGYQILVVEGKTASVAIAMLAKESTFTLNALILNNPYWPELELNKNIAGQIAKLPMPVLDLVNVSDNHWSTNTRSQRLAQTRINVKPFYRQRELAGGPLVTLPKEYIAKEIVGWTRYLGW